MAKSRRRHDAKGRSNREARHVRLYHWLMDTPAWASLDCVARCVYVELARRYGGEDATGKGCNGHIPCSLLELAKALHVSKATAMRALDKLEVRGFIVMTKQGAFNVKMRHSTEWRLTEFPCAGELATKDFARWGKN